MKLLKRLFSVIKNNKLSFSLVVITLLAVAFAFVQLDEKNWIEYQYINLKSTPPIDLSFDLQEVTGDITQPVFSGKVTGFVKFLDESEQPSGLNQFFIIKATDNFDYEYNQIFSIQEIIDFDNLPPHHFEEFPLTAKESSIDSILLEDSEGNQFIISLDRKSVRLFDATGDFTELVVSTKEYQKLKRGF